MASLGERVEALELRERELGENVADLGRRLTIAEVAIVGLVEMIEREVAELNERLTTVHRQALRELTRRAERSTTA